MSPVSVNNALVSLNNALVSLFTVSSQWWKWLHDSVKILKFLPQVCSLRDTKSVAKCRLVSFLGLYKVSNNESDDGNCFSLLMFQRLEYAVTN